MLNKLKQKYEALPPDKQKRVSQIAVIGLLIVLALAGYYSRGGHKQVKQENQGGFTDLNPNLGYLQKSLYYEVTNRVKEMDKRLTELQLQIKALNNKIHGFEEKNLETTGTSKKSITFNKVLEEKEKGKTSSFGLPKGVKVPPPPSSTSGVPSAGSKGQKPIVQTIGGIGSVTGSASSQKTKTAKGKKKKKKESVYLPPSFMEADLISGFAAPTMEAAKSEPVKTFLRIRDLAVLPNRVKGDLKGCFTIAEAYGSLADERAHLRLLRLSCIARDGSSVIDEPIKGFVVDEDGRIGLKGRVVAKMGSLLARSIAASFLQGFGDAYAASGYTQTVSGLGEITTLNPSDAIKAGIGKGIAEGPKQLSKFYMELARQTFPVIEVGAGKKVTIVIDTGVDMAIREKCLGGKNGCSEDQKKSVLYILAGF